MLACEGIIALVLAARFWLTYDKPFFTALWYGVFHAVLKVISRRKQDRRFSLCNEPRDAGYCGEGDKPPIRGEMTNRVWDANFNYSQACWHILLEFTFISHHPYLGF